VDLIGATCTALPRLSLKPMALVALEKPKRINSDSATNQGLTLVHFPAQLEPCLTHEHTLHTLHTP